MVEQEVAKRLIVFALAVLLAPLGAAAQPAGKAHRVGVLSPQNSTESPAVQREPFEQGLRELGWTPGSSVVIEYRFADGKSDRLAELARELVGLKVDVIVARGPQAIRMAQQATATIPIVMSAADDPLRSGFVASLSRPGGNITGLVVAQGELDEKRLQLLKQAIPKLTRVGMLVNWGAVPDPDGTVLKAIQAAARTLALEIHTFEVSKPGDIAAAFTAMASARVGALLLRPDPSVLEPNRVQVVALALKHRLPIIYPWQLYVEVGGLMSYGTSIPAFHRRSATYVDKILKGANPATCRWSCPRSTS